ncbi:MULTISPECIES: hypothetical protein [Bacillus cereus group]|uniref:hypothetical protein n=1 Tax=Bacillus cereus group TaxID=86661 RepID=UPI0022E40A09|nr:hypothetical protein [Bacillus cereus group sp. TH152-1LC]MDA1675059.1 hypothetical protein [Bacillus cereus group sp. TH152-1LC]
MNIELNKTYNMPSNCVSLLEKFEIGQKIKIKYDGGLGGVYEVEGNIIKIENPEFDIRLSDGREQGFIMADIVEITLLEDKEEVKKLVREELDKSEFAEKQKEIVAAKLTIAKLNSAQTEEDIEKILNTKNYPELKTIVKLLMNLI